MRQELDGILVQMRTIRTALRQHYRDAEALENKDEQLVTCLGAAARDIDRSIEQVQAASYRAPSSF